MTRRTALSLFQCKDVMANKPNIAHLRRLREIEAQIQMLEVQIQILEATPDDQEKTPKETGTESTITEAEFKICLKLFTESCTMFVCFFQEWKDTRKITIDTLITIAAFLEGKTHKTNIPILAGSSASLVGGILTIAGLITMPLTRKFSIIQSYVLKFAYCNNYTYYVYILNIN